MKNACFIKSRFLTQNALMYFKKKVTFTVKHFTINMHLNFDNFFYCVQYGTFKHKNYFSGFFSPHSHKKCVLYKFEICNTTIHWCCQKRVFFSKKQLNIRFSRISSSFVSFFTPFRLVFNSIFVITRATKKVNINQTLQLKHLITLMEK